jgi:hypothetical protein
MASSWLLPSGTMIPLSLTNVTDQGRGYASLFRIFPAGSIDQYPALSDIVGGMIGRRSPTYAHFDHSGFDIGLEAMDGSQRRLLHSAELLMRLGKPALLLCRLSEEGDEHTIGLRQVAVPMTRENLRDLRGNIAIGTQTMTNSAAHMRFLTQEDTESLYSITEHTMQASEAAVRQLVLRLWEHYSPDPATAIALIRMLADPAVMAALHCEVVMVLTGYWATDDTYQSQGLRNGEVAGRLLLVSLLLKGYLNGAASWGGSTTYVPDAILDPVRERERGLLDAIRAAAREAGNGFPYLTIV